MVRREGEVCSWCKGKNGEYRKAAKRRKVRLPAGWEV
jgi:hypothetical protein